MQYRQIGNSDLKVSEIALGSWLTYGGQIEDDVSRDCLGVTRAQSGGGHNRCIQTFAGCRKRLCLGY